MPHTSNSTIASNRAVSNQYRRSVSVAIDLSALRHNFSTARQLSGSSRLFATVKADAYGHGAIEIAQALSPAFVAKSANDRVADDSHLDSSTADGFAVVSVDEALELRHSGIQLPILVLQGPQTPDACDELAHHHCWPVIHDLRQYGWYRKQGARKQLKAWLKVDTGMGRLGVTPDQARSIMSARDGVSWMGMMTHFACADEQDNPFTDQQIDTFNSVENVLHLDRSLANSAALIAWPRARADWARPGIMLYGCNPMDRSLPAGVQLRPVMSVTAPLIAKKQLAAGSGVGYAQTWRCPEDMPVGYVALGYRDGLPRVLDASATVSIDGYRCPIIGRVSMDSVAVDMRQVPSVPPGAAVEFWGNKASVDDLATAAGTISYELLTSIRGRRCYNQ